MFGQVNIALKAAVVLMVAVCAIDAAAVGVAPRSVPSPGGNCYYECPPLNGKASNSFTRSFDGGRAIAICDYPNSDDFCQYNQDDGKLSDSSTNACQNQITTVKCTSTTQGNPDSGKYFKRSMVPKILSGGEKRLAERQYKPKSKKSQSG